MIVGNILKDIINFSLSGLIHNHPSGDPTPSKADADMTRAVATARATLGIDLHDHLVIGRAGLRGLGLI